MRRQLRIASSAALIAVAAGTQAAEDPNSDRIGLVIDAIDVVGTRTERNLDEVDATISVIDGEDIERRIFRDIQDLVRYEPAVSGGGTGFEFGTRFSGACGEAQIEAFTTEYGNFIESLAIAPAFSDTGRIDPADGLLTF